MMLLFIKGIHMCIYVLPFWVNMFLLKFCVDFEQAVLKKKSVTCSNMTNKIALTQRFLLGLEGEFFSIVIKLLCLIFLVLLMITRVISDHMCRLMVAILEETTKHIFPSVNEETRNICTKT